MPRTPRTHFRFLPLRAILIRIFHCNSAYYVSACITPLTSTFYLTLHFLPPLSPRFTHTLGGDFGDLLNLEVGGGGWWVVVEGTHTCFPWPLPPPTTASHLHLCLPPHLPACLSHMHLYRASHFLCTAHAWRDHCCLTCILPRFLPHLSCLHCTHTSHTCLFHTCFACLPHLPSALHALPLRTALCTSPLTPTVPSLWHFSLPFPLPCWFCLHAALPTYTTTTSAVA